MVVHIFVAELPVFTLWEPDNQTISTTVQGFIRSPAPQSLILGEKPRGSCTLNLIIQPPFSVEIKVIGKFKISLEQRQSSNCLIAGSLWIKHKNQVTRECGYKENNSILLTVNDPSTDDLSTITLGVDVNESSKRLMEFRLLYTGKYNTL